DISANAKETRAQNAFEYAKGFNGIEAISIDGANFTESYLAIQKVLVTIRNERRPFLVHARVPLLNHHTSGVRMEWYRDDLDEAKSRDPYPVLIRQMKDAGFALEEIEKIESDALAKVKADYDKALKAEDPRPEDLFTHDFAPTPITEEKGERSPEPEDKVVLVDCALFAVE